MCVVKFFLGIACPGCGFLHCLWALGHLDWEKAFVYFPIWPIVFLFFLFRKKVIAGKIFVVALFTQWVIRIF